jgi:hypothetical protein
MQKLTYGGHEWDHISFSRCALCGCRREEYEDNLKPYCHPTANFIVVTFWHLRGFWNRGVWFVARSLTIGS